MAHAQSWQKAHYNRHHHVLELSVGHQLLMVTTHFLLSVGRKVGQHWVEPFFVVAQVGWVAYSLDLLASMHIYPVFCISMLKPYNGPSEL